MKHQLKVLADNQPAVMERLLQVTRYRGFNVTALNMQQVKTNQQLEFSLVLDSERPIKLLLSQLNKLVDVTKVYLTDTVVKSKTKKIFESNMQSSLVTAHESKIASA